MCELHRNRSEGLKSSARDGKVKVKEIAKNEVQDMSTIYDIARETGFSPSTVARALSGRGYCGEAAREVILEAAKRLQYVPVQAAKVLKNKKTKKVMFCIPDIYNPYYFSMIEGANRVLEKHGYYMVLVHSEHNKSKELGFVEALKEQFVDGLIMGSFDFYPGLIQAIRGASVPVVLTNFYESGDGKDNFDCVYVDHTKAIYIATAEMIERGHRNIVFMGGKNTEQTGIERLRGYRAAMEDRGLKYDERYVISSDFTRGGGRRDFETFMKRKLPFTAVVASNDLMGIGCMNACQKLGISIPEDVSIVTLDNTDYCACTFPRLSSVNMMQYQIGYNSAELLMERIEEKRDYKKVVMLEPTLVERNSVAEVKKV